MQRVRLIHWNTGEAKERGLRLAALGYEVDHAPLDGPAGLRALRTDPPAAFVIDLGRIPSQGRDVAMSLRISKATRRVPLVFVDGEPGKVARVRASLPDAAYTTWERIGPALARAIARPPESPIVPDSALAGYSGVPLVKKLGIKPRSVAVLVGAPDGFEKALGALPEGARLVRRAAARRDLTIWFARSRAELDRRVGEMARLEAGAGLWIAWPKKASGVATDLSETVVRETGLASGLVDHKISAFDATWAGLRFVRRKARGD